MWQEHFDISTLANVTTPQHYRALLTVDLYYALRRNKTLEMVGEIEFRRSRDGMTEIPARKEIFSIVWHPSPELREPEKEIEKLRILGEECLCERTTLVDAEIDAKTIDNVVKKNVREHTAVFKALPKEEQRFYRQICEELAERIAKLEIKGHKVTIDFQHRIKFEPGCVRVTGQVAVPYQAYGTGEAYTKIPMAILEEKRAQIAALYAAL